MTKLQRAFNDSQRGTMGAAKLTEDQIERTVERRTDEVDAAFLAGAFSQEEYDRRIAQITAWADAQYTKKEG